MDARTQAIADLNAVRENALYLKAVSQKPLMAVVKANAYGHGDIAVAKSLRGIADWYAVAVPEEGVRLRSAGIDAPVLVLSEPAPDQLENLFEYRLTPTIGQTATAELLSKAGAKHGITLSVHIAVDSGMGRIGFHGDEIAEQIAPIFELNGIAPTGIFTHFATADGDDDYFSEQCNKFRAVLGDLKRMGYTGLTVHAANSAGILRHPEAYFDMVRGGLALYGTSPKGKFPLKPALRWVTRVAHLKTLPIGSAIGYGCTFVTYRETRVATLPVGYADGYPRSLSNRFYVLIRGQRAPILGRVCMDQMMADVTDIDGVELGEEVTLLGRDGKEEITPDKMGEFSHSCAYEILSRIGGRVERTFLP